MRRVALLGVLAVVVAGCSGDASSGSVPSSPTPPPVTTAAVSATTLPDTTDSSTTSTTTTMAADAATSSTAAADMTPPILVITDPVPGTTVTTGTYTFRGVTDPGCTVSVWDRWEADVDEAGNWSIALNLKLGSNVTRLKAVDAAGNETATEVSVDYVPPPMPCNVDADTRQEYCRNWGDIVEVDLDRSEIVFDLYRYVSTGPEEYEFEYVNENPLLRTLRVAGDVEIRACTPEPGSEVPSPGCGAPDDFAYWALSDLAAFVAAGADWWGVTTQDSLVFHIEQWWWP